MGHQAFAELLGNYGDFIGGLAVVATLIYLSIQIRQNSAIVKANARAQSNQALTDFFRYLGSDPERLRLFHASAQEFAALSPIERRQHLYLLRYFFMSSEFLYGQYVDGLIAESVWTRQLDILASALTAPHIAAYWQLRKHVLDPEFAAVVDSVPWENQQTPDEVAELMIERAKSDPGA